MSKPRFLLALRLVPLCLAQACVAFAQTEPSAEEEAVDPVEVLVSRLTFDKYKTTLKDLTQFGDRRQGTKRNRDALDWIEQFLIDVGCQDVERLDYVYDPEPREPRGPRPQPDNRGLTTSTGGKVGRNGS
ncbi:MAG: hypothetical protein VYD01_05110, partial [Pseudomonadota bacterium]|nr:hypothetical protein [Pseudomonadota bacterium]